MGKIDTRYASIVPRIALYLYIAVKAWQHFQKNHGKNISKKLLRSELAFQMYRYRGMLTKTTWKPFFFFTFKHCHYQYRCSLSVPVLVGPLINTINIEFVVWKKKKCYKTLKDWSRPSLKGQSNSNLLFYFYNQQINTKRAKCASSDTFGPNSFCSGKTNVNFLWQQSLRISQGRMCLPLLFSWDVGKTADVDWAAFAVVDLPFAKGF